MKISLEELEKRLADLRARLPQHSIPPSMLVELEELEEEWSRRRTEVEIAGKRLEDSNDADLRLSLYGMWRAV